MKKFKYIKNIKSKSWKKCVICHTHIKEENLWKVKIPFKYISILTHKYFVCQNCCSTFDDVNTWRKDVINLKMK